MFKNFAVYILEACYSNVDFQEAQGPLVCNLGCKHHQRITTC